MSEAAATHCPTCNASNPIGAKFCSACRAALIAAVPPVNPLPPPPPPPPRPGIGGMMGQMGGKAVTRKVSGDATAVYAELVSYVSELPSTELQHEVPPQQLSAKVAYKDFTSTGGIVITVDTSISVTPIAPGQSQVSVTTKTDMSSTNKIWIYNMFFAACGVFLLPWQLLAIVVVLAVLATFWLMSTAPGQNISNNLFEHLGKNAAKLASAPGAGTPVAANPLTAVPAAAPPPTPVPAAPATPATLGVTGETATPSTAVDNTEDEVFTRIKKLAELRDAGAINEADFEAKKLDLLSRI